MGAKSKVVSDASKLPPSDNHAEILKQVEFYFSDANLPHDKFLWQTTQKNGGWVPIETIHKFKRMHRFQPADAVVAALRESPEMLEVSEDGKSVRRRVPLKEPAASAKKDSFARSVYAKGFGPETETTQFDIENWFGRFGPTNQVRLRRSDDGAFKESVFAEFETLDSAKKFVEAKHEYEGTPLLVMSKQAYVAMKAQEHGFADTANGKRRRPFNAFHQDRPSKRTFKGRKEARNTKSVSDNVSNANEDTPKDEGKEPEENKPAETSDEKAGATPQEELEKADKQEGGDEIKAAAE